MIFKCKICCGQLEFKQGDLVTVCPYCGLEQSLPRLDQNERLFQLYAIANSYLMNNEFDKAERLFYEIVSLKPDDPEGYWQLVMCKYGITYVTDSKSGEKIPTVNRTYYSSILDDINYKKTISFSSGKQQAIYIRTAKYINNVQNSIVSISRKEKPYDIFICYKERNHAGERTEESVKAQELYDRLTALGYKVFFSRITLENKIGAEYEPYIFAALTSARVMLCIGSSKENFEAVWVKNEWSRYLRLIQSGEEKTMIPIVINNAQLPEEFSNIAPQEMNSNGFEQELIRGIKKMIPTPVEELARKKRRNKILGRIGLAAGVAIIIASILSIPVVKKNKAYNAAKELYHSKHYAESAWAFRELKGYRDSDAKAAAAENAWRKSVAVIVYDSFAYAKSAGFKQVNCEANRYGAYIDTNGNVQEFFSKITDTTDDVDAVHGKVCDIIDLYDDGYLMGSLSLEKGRQEVADHVIQAFRTCEGYLYLKTDGTVGTKCYEDNIMTNGYTGRLEENNERYTNWAETTETWSDIVRLSYYNDFLFSEDTISEFLVGIKADGTVLVGGQIENIDIGKMDFSKIDNAVDADVMLTYTNTDDPEPTDAIFAFLLNDGKVKYYKYSLYVHYGIEPDEEIALNNRIVDCAFSAEDNSIILLCSNGRVYRYCFDEVTADEINVGGNNVYITPYMAITKSGEPQFFKNNGFDQCLPSSFKTRMYDEYSERID